MTENGLHISDDEVAALPPSDVVRAVDEAFQALGRGEIDNPPREETVGRPGDPNFLCIDMRATWSLPEAGDATCTCRKVIEESSTRDESGERALGARRAWIGYSDSATGRDATLDAEAITNVRTAAAALLAARYLTVGGDVGIAVIGTGRVAREIVRLAEHVLDVSWIRATSRSPERRETFARKLGDIVNSPLSAAPDIASCCRGADVIIAAVPSREPVVTGEIVSGASHVALVGGDPRSVLATREVWSDRAVVPDDFIQATRTGDLVRARGDGWLDSVSWARHRGAIGALGDAALGELDGLRRVPTTALLTGLAALDLAVSRVAVNRRLALG